MAYQLPSITEFKMTYGTKAAEKR